MEFSAPTMLYQAVLFVALYFVLKSLVFDRFLANLDARHQRTRGALEEAKQLHDQAARLQADYEQQMAAVRHEAATARDEIRRQAEREEQEIIETARREAARFLAEARQKIAAEAQTTRVALAADTARLSEQILAGLLGRRS